MINLDVWQKLLNYIDTMPFNGSAEHSDLVNVIQQEFIPLSQPRLRTDSILEEDKVAIRILNLHIMDRPFSFSLIISAMKEYASYYIEKNAPSPVQKEEAREAVELLLEFQKVCKNLLAIYRKYANDNPQEDYTCDYAESLIEKVNLYKQSNH